MGPKTFLSFSLSRLLTLKNLRATWIKRERKASKNRKHIGKRTERKEETKNDLLLAALQA